MAGTDREKEWALKASRFLRAELKRAGLTYAHLAEKLNEHGLKETEGSVGAKVARGSFPVAFWLACLAVLELGETTLADL
jgi:hypothetical protein